MSLQRNRHPAARRASRHGRHGRLGRSNVLRPPLMPLDGRMERFEITVNAAADFLRSGWPELREVGFVVADHPPPVGPDITTAPRWLVQHDQRRIVLFRIPIERLSSRYRFSDFYARAEIEGSVIRAAAEYLGKEPWELGPGGPHFH